MDYHRNIRVTIRQKMASILRYVEAALEDFVLFADESPLWAVITIYLVLALLFSNLWATEIIRLQQSILLDLRGQVSSTSPGSEFFNTGTSCFTAGYTCDIEIPYILDTPRIDATASKAVQVDSGSFRKPLKGSTVTVTQSSLSNLGISDPRPKRNGAGLSSIARPVPNQPYLDYYVPYCPPIQRHNISNSGNRNGRRVVSPPVQNRTYVSFYASSSPSNRGELNSPICGFIRGTWFQILAN